MSPLDTKHGRLEMVFSRDKTGKSILSHLYRKVPMVVQQALYFDEKLPQIPCIYILSSGGPIVEGDHYSVGLRLEADTMAHISTGAASVVASMEGGAAEMVQRVELHSGAYLEWLPQPIIPGRGARYRGIAEISIAPGASLFWSEVVTCGRLHHGERFDYERFELRTTLRRPEGEVLLRERLVLRPTIRSPEEWALLGGYDHFASVLMVAPEENITPIYDNLKPIVHSELRMSIARLNRGCGLAIRLLGSSTQLLLGITRELCSLLRKEIKGVPLAAEFPWRQGGTRENNIGL